MMTLNDDEVEQIALALTRVVTPGFARSFSLGQRNICPATVGMATTASADPVI